MRTVLEPFTLAMAQLAYEGDSGPRIAYRMERFGKAASAEVRTW